MRRRIRLAVLAVLTAAPLPLDAAFAQAPTAKPTADGAGLIPPATKSPINPDMLARILKIISSAGHDGELPASIAGPLGLTNPAQAWPDRQFAVQGNETGAVHAIAISRAADSDLVFSVRRPAAISIFRAHRDGTLVDAVDFFPGTQQSMKAPVGQARTDFAAECAFWAKTLAALDADN